MNDYTYFFNSDYVTHTMIDVMSPRELFFYRQITKYAYNTITLDIINNKITNGVSNNLKIIFKNRYEEFINLVEKRKIIIHGPFVTKVIWGELHKANIHTYMTEKTMGSTNNNVFIDYKNIDSEATYDADNKFDFFKGWFNFESDDMIVLNDYSDINKIKLWIVAEQCVEEEGVDFPDNYPEILQNRIKIVNNKFIVEIKNINLVMHKIQPVYFDQRDNFDNNTYCTLNKLCIKYNITCKFFPLKACSGDDYGKFISVVCKKDAENIYFTMLNNYFCSNKNGRISCDPIDVINSDKLNKLYIDVKIEEFVEDCKYSECPFKELCNQYTNPLKHFHSCIFLKKDTTKMVAMAIIFKYDDTILFSNFPKHFNVDKNITIDSNIIDSEIYMHEFPPRPVPKGYFGTDINTYKKIFNNNFDEGEFASDGPYCDMDAAIPDFLRS